MADNIAITEGSGKTVSTEEITNLNGAGVSAQHGQRVIVAMRTADGTAVDLVPGQVAKSNSLSVTLASDEGALPVSDNGGTLSVDDAGGSLTVDGTVTAVGNVAHDTGDSGSPVKIGAVAANAEPTAVANGDRVNLIADLAGKLINLPYANPENFLAGKTADITNTSDTAVIAAQGASVRIYVTQLVVTNSHATVGTWVNIKDGSTTIYTGYAAAAGGGFALMLPVPLRLTANTALNAACETTGSNVRVSASGYKGA